MNTYFKRALVALTVALSLMLMAPSGASASTGPWQWTDISNKLTATDNRPVWAIARAEPYWYLTDGLELWSGGHVWRTDGAIMSDITLEVRNAGISRIDDIVSDGQSVIYLKNVVKTDNSFEALLYNGTYSSPASVWKSQLNSNEGLASVNGKNGVWMIVTTQGRIFKWTQSTNSIIQVTPPGNYTLSYSTLLYSTRHTSPADDRTSFLVTQVVPTSNGWIFVVPQTYNSYPYTATNWRVYQYTSDGYFSDLSSNFSGLQYVNTVASNGNQVLIIGGDQATSYNHAYKVENTYVTSLYNVPSIAWYKALVGYNGKSWMVVSGKDLVRFDGTSFQTYGQTQDYFIQTIGNGSGTFLLGGAVSSLGSNSPSSPLTAKLVRADEGVYFVNTTASTVSNSTVTTYNQTKLATVNGYKNRITYWAWFNPGYKYQANNTVPKYTVGAQSNDGIKRIDLYVNDVYQKTCLPKNTKKNTTCSTNINPSDWPLDSNVGAFAKITSAKNRVTYVPASIIRFYDAGTATVSGTNSALSANMSVDNNTSYLQRGTTSNIYVTGNASEGINRIEIYVNGIIKQTCSLNGSQSGSCSLALNGNDYNSGSAVSFNGRVVTQNGREVWTWLGQYMVTDYGTSYNANSTTLNSNTLSANLWFDPASTDFSTNNTKNIMAQAIAPAGLKSIEILVSGAVKQSCSFSNVYGTQSCQATIYGSNYSGYFNVPVYVRATDANNQTATSQTLYLNPTSYIYSNSYNYNNNGNSTVTVSTSDGRSSYNSNETFTFYGYDSDSDGVQRIDLYANGTYVNSCSLSNATYGSCSASIVGSNYASGTSLPLQAKATDRNGNVTWSSTLNVTVNGSNNNNNNNSNGTVTVSTADGRTSYNNYETFTFNGYDSDSDGIQRIDLYANSTYVNSCSLSNNTYGTCSASILASSYANGSTIPLQAKATDRYGNVTWSNTLNVTVNDYYIGDRHNTVTVSTSDGRSTYNNNESITFNGYDSNDLDGIQRIDLYANSTLVKTCTFDNTVTYGTCSASIVGSNYVSGSSLPLQAKATDRNNRYTWSNTLNVTISNYSNNGNGNGTVTVSTSDGRSSYNSNDQISFTGYDTDSDGIQQIDLYAGSIYVTTCNLSNATYGSCWASIVASRYVNGSSLPLQAKATDRYGNVTWSSTLNLTVNGSNNNNGNSTVTVSTSDGRSSYNSNETFTFYGYDSDSDGVQRIDLYANGTYVNSCSLSNATYGSCSASIVGSNYASGSSLPLQAKATDRNGNVTWSSTLNVTVNGSNNNNNNQNDTHGTISVSSNADNGYTGSQQITFTANGSDANGVKRIEIYIGTDLVNSCNGATTCSYTGGPFNAYQLIYGAKLIDQLDNTVWSGYKTINRI